MFRELFRRLPDVDGDERARPAALVFVNGIKHLPCAFTPAR